MPAKKLTLADAKAMCDEMGMSLRKIDGEYQVKPKSQQRWDADGTYYTNDLQDAYGTAVLIADKLDEEAGQLDDAEELEALRQSEKTEAGALSAKLAEYIRETEHQGIEVCAVKDWPVAKEVLADFVRFVENYVTQ